MARNLITTNATVHTPQGTFREVAFTHRQGNGRAVVTPKRSAQVLAEGPSLVDQIAQPSSRTYVVSFRALEDGTVPEEWTVTTTPGCGCGG